MKNMLVLFVISLAMLSANAVLNPLRPSETYTHFRVMDDTDPDAYKIFWKLLAGEIQFEIHCRALGWCGFGWSPAGDMYGADIMIGWVDDATNVGYVKDCYSRMKLAPSVDRKQDWILLESGQINGYTILKVKRKLDTLDTTEDIAIVNETHNLICAWSENDPSPNGSDWRYHGRTRSSIQANLLGAN